MILTRPEETYRKKPYRPTVRFPAQIVNKSSEDSFAFALHNWFNQLSQVESRIGVSVT